MDVTDEEGTPHSRLAPKIRMRGSRRSCEWRFQTPTNSVDASRRAERQRSLKLSFAFLFHHHLLHCEPQK